jgi:hypothetical protein
LARISARACCSALYGNSELGAATMDRLSI